VATNGYESLYPYLVGYGRESAARQATRSLQTQREAALRQQMMAQERRPFFFDLVAAEGGDQQVTLANTGTWVDTGLRAAINLVSERWVGFMISALAHATAGAGVALDLGVKDEGTGSWVKQFVSTFDLLTTDWYLTTTSEGSTFADFGTLWAAPLTAGPYTFSFWWRLTRSSGSGNAIVNFPRALVAAL
jgi:hypothetical protein